LFLLDCRLRFNYATLESSYPLTLVWREPRFQALDGSVVVENPNPVPLNLTVVAYRLPGYLKAWQREVTVKPFTRVVLEAGHGVMIRFYYSFAGHPRVYSLRT
jgi:hypothetical protein